MTKQAEYPLKSVPVGTDLLNIVDSEDDSQSPAGSTKRILISSLPSSGGGGFSLTRTAVKTSGYTAAAGDLVPVDTTSGAVTVTLPNAPSANALVAVKHIIQGAANAVTVACAGSDVFNKASGSTTAVLSLLNQGILLQYNGSGVWTVLSDDLPLTQLGSVFVNATGGGLEKVSALGSVSGAVTLNLANGNVFTATATGNITFTFSGATNGLACSFTLFLTQDGTGGHAVTWPGSVTWLGGVAPAIGSAAGAVTVLVFETVNGGTTWYGSMAGNAPSLPLAVSFGGTGGAALTAFALTAGGVTSTSPLQQVSGLGTAGQPLISQGPGALPAWGGAWVPTVFTLTDGSSVPVNAALGNLARWALGGASHTLAAPTNPKDGQPLKVRIIYGGTFTPLFNAIFDFGTDGQPAWTSVSGKVDEIGFAYNADANGGAGTWGCQGWKLGL
jgi:hypothetical protein